MIYSTKLLCECTYKIPKLNSHLNFPDLNLKVIFLIVENSLNYI